MFNFTISTGLLKTQPYWWDINRFNSVSHCFINIIFGVIGVVCLETCFADLNLPELPLFHTRDCPVRFTFFPGPEVITEDFLKVSIRGLFVPLLQLRMSLEDDSVTPFVICKSTLFWRFLTCSSSHLNLCSKSFLSDGDRRDGENICTGTPKVSSLLEFNLLNFRPGALEPSDTVISVSILPELAEPSISPAVWNLLLWYLPLNLPFFAIILANN